MFGNFLDLFLQQAPRRTDCFAGRTAGCVCVCVCVSQKQADRGYFQQLVFGSLSSGHTRAMMMSRISHPTRAK